MKITLKYISISFLSFIISGCSALYLGSNKQSNFDPYIQKKIDKVQHICETRGLSQTQIIISLWSRQSTIQENCVGYHFQIHNGKTYKKLIITQDMVGKKFGEFAPTRRFVTHKKKKTT